ncbi:MAG: hypothetical protein RL748_2394 [Pseudomonadota bacterium]|jgi:hypothetical protein
MPQHSETKCNMVHIVLLVVQYLRKYASFGCYDLNAFNQAHRKYNR